MQINRPTAIIASLSTASLGGAIGSIISAHDPTQSGNIWAFFALMANMLFLIYKDHKQRRYMREEQERQAARERRLNEELTRQTAEIKASMRTRLSDLGLQLDKLVQSEIESDRRRAGDHDL